MNEAISPFVATVEDYGKLRAGASDVFVLDRGGLPDQVFASGFGAFCFVEFDVMLCREFWAALAACGEAAGDRDVSIMIHDPHPEAYYFANFGRYGAFRLNLNATERDYKSAFLLEPEGSPADALQYVSSAISWWGSSQQWGFWGERDLGVGVGAARNKQISWPSINGVRWFDVDGALSNLIAPNFENGVIPAGFAAKFRSNFGT